MKLICFYQGFKVYMQRKIHFFKSPLRTNIKLYNFIIYSDYKSVKSPYFDRYFEQFLNLNLFWYISPGNRAVKTFVIMQGPGFSTSWPKKHARNALERARYANI